MFGFSPFLSIGLILIAGIVFGLFWFIFNVKGKAVRPKATQTAAKTEEQIMEDVSLLEQDELLIRVKTAFEKEDLLLAEEYLFHLVKRATDESLVRESLEKLIEVTIQNEKYTLALEQGTRYRMTYGEVIAVELLLSKAYIELNDLDRAMEIFEKVLAEEQQNEDALSGMAMLYRKLGNHERAREIQQELFSLQQGTRD